MKAIHWIFAVMTGVTPVGFVSSVAAETTFETEYEARLYAGQTTEALALATAELAAHPEDGRAAFALGTAQFLGAVEHFGQGLYGFGLQDEYNTGDGGLIGLPFLRLPVPPNPAPQKVTYAGLRGLLERFVADLAVAEATLATVGRAEFDLRLDLGRIRLDFDGDGKGIVDEALLASFGAVSGRAESATGYLVDFDQSDAVWLQGYCHLLSAMAEFPLAHDWHLAFEQTFHGLFPQSDLPSSPLNDNTAELVAAIEDLLAAYGGNLSYPRRPPGEPKVKNFPTTSEYQDALKAYQATDAYEDYLERLQTYRAYRDMKSALWMGSIADVIGFIHLFHWDVVEPARMASARDHLLKMVTLSRENWVRIQAETDSGREWVSNTHQTGIFSRLRVTEARISEWHEFLDTFEAVLEGRRLIKHWRFHDKGINVRRMFEEPRAFDPVLIGQGTAVLPYLETGDLVGADTFETMMRVFEGGFLAYFIWFN